MHYTVKQLADLAGVTPRALHHYDHIGLLRPTTVGDNGYRYYDDDAVLRLPGLIAHELHHLIRLRALPLGHAAHVGRRLH